MLFCNNNEVVETKQKYTMYGINIVLGSIYGSQEKGQGGATIKPPFNIKLFSTRHGWHVGHVVYMFI